MANGGGSRIGGFFRGVLVGLFVCAIAAVALSLSAPVPERGTPEVEVLEPEGTAAERSASGAEKGAVPEPEPASPQAPGAGGTPEAESDVTPETEVIVVPPEEADAGRLGAPAGENATPQATWPETPTVDETEPPAEDGAFPAPQSPSQ